MILGIRKSEIMFIIFFNVSNVKCFLEIFFLKIIFLIVLFKKDDFFIS